MSSLIVDTIQFYSIWRRIWRRKNSKPLTVQKEKFTKSDHRSFCQLSLKFWWIPLFKIGPNHNGNTSFSCQGFLLKLNRMLNRININKWFVHHLNQIELKPIWSDSPGHHDYLWYESLRRVRFRFAEAAILQLAFPAPVNTWKRQNASFLSKSRYMCVKVTDIY